MGNPEFAIPTLKAIQKSDHDLVAVVSNPPKPMGRGKSLSLTPVGEYAKQNRLYLLEPASLNSKELNDELKNLKPDIFVVVAFRILPKSLIELPRYGSINLHASLLPKYRGAGPIQWALINGEKKTGVTIFQIRPKVDTGEILMQKEIPIKESDNMLSLGSRLCEYGSKMIIDTLDLVQENPNIKGEKQNPLKATQAPKISKEMTIINWELSCYKIHNWVRGLSPYPGMVTTYNKKRLIIFKTKIVERDNLSPGMIFIKSRESLYVGTGKGVLEIFELQIEGKKKMKIKDFLRGSNMISGEFLGQ